MGQRDAFGNEKGEDTFAGLGWISDGTSVSAPAAPPVVAGSVPPPPPAPAPERQASNLGAGVGSASANEAFGELSTGPTAPPSATAARLPGLPRRKRPFSGWRRFGMVIPVVVIAVIASVLSLGKEVSRVNDGRRAISVGFDEVTTTAISTEGPATPAAPPVGLGKGSLLKAGNFEKALAILRTEGSRASSIRVAPELIFASIVTASGSIRQVQVTWQGERRRFGQYRPPSTQASTFPIADVDTSAPARLTRSAAGRAKGSVDYLVAISLGTAQQGWTVVLKDGGGQYLADSRGRITRRIN